MHKLKLLFLATSVVTGLVLAGCGDDDGGNADPDGGSGNPDANIDPDGGPDGNVGPQTLPSYVKSLIETKTAENTTPEGEAAWGSLADDDTAATSAALFPPQFFQ